MKDTGKKFLNCKGKLIGLDEPLVMGILNTTPDSFFEESRAMPAEAAVEKALEMVNEGAAIIDIGGYSSRPGAKDISISEEQDRVLPVIEAINKERPELILSVDTFRASVAKNAIRAGASIVNDISGGDFDEEMFKTVADLQVPYILMHMQGSPQTMQKDPQYVDVVNDISRFFSAKLTNLQALGVNDVILDPGFGFGKTVEHNYDLLIRLKEFSLFNYPILAGISRKSIVNKLLNVKAVDALNGTTALHIYCLQNGAAILRVHDVKEAVEAIKIHKFVRSRHQTR